MDFAYLCRHTCGVLAFMQFPHLCAQPKNSSWYFLPVDAHGNYIERCIVTEPGRRFWFGEAGKQYTTVDYLPSSAASNRRIIIKSGQFGEVELLLDTVTRGIIR